MKQELGAYLIRGDGCVSTMPTDELLVALDHLLQAGIAQGQCTSCDKASVSEFLQALKRTMQTAKDMDRVPRKEGEGCF